MAQGRGSARARWLPARLAAVLLVATAPWVTSPVAHGADSWNYGSVSAPSHPLWPGCHSRMVVAHYSFNPPSDHWSAEFFLVDRRGETVASNAVDAGSDPPSGTRPFGFCSQDAPRGAYVLRTKFTYVTFWDPNGSTHWMAPVHLRLGKPGTRTTLPNRHRARSLHQTPNGWVANRGQRVVVRALWAGRWHTVRRLTTDRRGWVSFRPPPGLSIRVRTLPTRTYRASVSRRLG